MSASFIVFALAALAVGFVVIAALKARRNGAAKATSGFKAKTFLTANELEFLNRLEIAAPELRFHAQVAMGAILDPATSKKSNARAHMSARGRFSQKIIDFVAQRRDNGAVVAIIELDDRTHSVQKDAQRDAMLKDAGYRVIRWTSKNKPEIAVIRAELTTSAQPQTAVRAAVAAPKNKATESRLSN